MKYSDLQNPLKIIIKEYIEASILCQATPRYSFESGWFNLTHDTGFNVLKQCNIMRKIYDRSYFFDQGIQFECQRCGACCNGDPGTVYVDLDEVKHIAEYLSEDIHSFTDKYLLPLRAGYTIKEHSDGRCFFYNNGCTIYPVRPLQCKTFPFWFENLRSNKKWKRVLKECPGIGCGRLYSKERILEIVQSTMEAVAKSYMEDK